MTTVLGREYRVILGQPPDKVLPVVGESLAGATLLPAIGLWEGARETSTVVLFVTTGGLPAAKAYAGRWAMALGEQCAYLASGAKAYIIAAERGRKP